MLQRVLWRVWEAGQQPALDRDVHELTSIVLQLVGQRLEHLKAITTGDLGDVTSSALLDLACTAAHGCLFADWHRKVELRNSAQSWELAQLSKVMVPDYDPEVDAARRVDRAAKGQRAVYQMPLSKVREKQEPLCKVPGDSKEAV